MIHSRYRFSFVINIRAVKSLIREIHRNVDGNVDVINSKFKNVRENVGYF